MAGDCIKVFAAVVSRIEAEATLGTTEGDIDDRTLEGHQRSQCFDFVLVDSSGKSDATLSWQPVLTVGGTPTLKYLEFPLNFNLKTNLVNGSTFPK